ncbi:hypothetical protein HPL003_13510 [Paenibacillus terrae HPL-003]|uniref:Uncharacterized protein n=1 Tax=Paenibacillus terrae (strain HPL-003) TaxID=985665 RepID=G7VXL1_PAETH|nr:hypothetical protein [Paenibacillus terrae]AET59453.1 hypothetical protein HPL003_13510 [Paenibacillus terrae HPL-003]
MQKEDIYRHIKVLELELFKFSPYRYIRDLIKDPNDILLYKNLLRNTSLDNQSIEYLVQIIVSYMKDNQRFRRVECMKILKRIIKNRSSNEFFESSLINGLFYLYKCYIFTGSDEIQWAVSVFIKDQLLSDDDIKWLIDNCDDSEHLTNRLLRYPRENPLITEWAEQTYKSGDLSERLSEVVSLLIIDDVPSYVSVDSVTLMWSIYYSKIEEGKKENLILKYLDFNDYSSALEIAERLNIPSVVNKLLIYYKDRALKYEKVANNK